MFGSFVKWFKGLDTGAVMKIVAGAFLLVGGLGVTLAAKDDSFLLEDELSKNEVIPAQNVEVIDTELNDSKE